MDKIPNVLFTCAKIIRQHKNLIEASVLQSQLVPRLKDMTQDSDKDVAYFAMICLQD